ncbi:MAG TPA: hypothetical protein IGS40_22455 [Trichormus sp. M33_DOE_039]|nr:hypothetical protein [Trichormus sp. M33_DOE_039]
MNNSSFDFRLLTRISTGIILLPSVIVLLWNGCADDQITSDDSLNATNTTVSQSGNHFTITNDSLNIRRSFVGTTADSIKLNQQVMSDRTWSVFVTSLLTESRVKRQHKHPNHNIIPSKLLPGIVTPKEK